jgi:hypothetical protein
VGPEAAEVSDTDPRISTAGTHVLTLQTTVSAKDAQTVILGGLTERQGSKWRRIVVLLTPRIVD